MNSFAIAAAELRAIHTQLNVIGDNVANVTTPGYPTRAAQLVSLNPGVKVGAIVTAPNPGVDLVTQFAGLLMAHVAYRSALRVIAGSGGMTHALFATV
jgi:flagellar basal body rod protein FlgC